MRPARRTASGLLAGFLALANMAHAAACPHLSLDSPAYEAAFQRLAALPEVKAWMQQVEQRQHHVSFGSGKEVEEVEIDGRCHIPVVLSEDQPDALRYWQTYFVAGPKDMLYVQDPVTGDPKPLASPPPKADRD